MAQMLQLSKELIKLRELVMAIDTVCCCRIEDMQPNVP